jgi:hypothetical protein
MKTLLAILTALFMFPVSSFAQTDGEADSLTNLVAEQFKKVFSTKVELDIDATLFPAQQGNFYINEEEQAMIMILVAPQSFAKAEEHFEKETEKDGYKVLEKRKFTHDGKNILYQKGSLEADGNKAVMYTYAIEASADATIFFTGMHMDGDEKKFLPAIERAALSAKLADQK